MVPLLLFPIFKLLVPALLGWWGWWGWWWSGRSWRWCKGWWMVWRWWWCDSSPHDVHVPLLFVKCGPCGVFGGFVWKFDYFDIPDVSVFGACLWMVDCYASALLCYDSVLGGVPWGFCGCFCCVMRTVSPRFASFCLVW